MRRHPMLQPLSDDHHGALVLARRLKQFAEKQFAEKQFAEKQFELKKSAREHSAGKLLVGSRNALELDLLSRDVRHAFEQDLEPHFEIEERSLIPALEAVGENHLAQQVLDQHVHLRELVGSRWSPSVVAELGECLEKHVRFEERVVFPEAERLLSVESLAAVQEAATSSRMGREESTSRLDAGNEGKSRELPGGTVLWIFVALELLTFGLFFIAFAIAQRSEPGVFAAGTAQLHAFLGAVNTCVLLTGGLFAAQGVLANARNEARSTSVWLWLAALSGVVFMTIKVYEYVDVLGGGVTLSTNSFWFYYLFVTGLHFLHVFAGVLFLVPTAWRASQAAYGAAESTPVEAVAVFWHLVDLIWVFVFPLFYLVHPA